MPSDHANIDPQSVILHASRKARINRIQSGFAKGFTRAITYKTAGLRLRGPGLDGAVLAQAAHSGNKPGQGQLGQVIKRWFLAAQYRWFDALLAKSPNAAVLVWNGIKGHRSLFAHAARQHGRQVVFLEESPLPGRIAVDTQGVNFGASLPRRADFYQAWAKEAGCPADHWRRNAASLVPRQADTRKDVGQENATTALSSQNFIFCPLQVPGDSQITIYGDWIAQVDDMIDALAAAVDALPSGWHLRIKEHPSAKQSFGEKLNDLSGEKFRVDNATNTMQQAAHARAVLNVNSSVGLQAFFYDKPVLVLGHAFYAFDGLARKVDSVQELRDIFADVDALSFDAAARDAFMNYLDSAYYPTEADMIAGRFSIRELRARDAERDRVLASLP